MKIKYKLSISISIVIFLIFSASILVNNFTLGKFYFWTKKLELNKLTKELLYKDLKFIQENIEQYESDYDSNIIIIPYEENINNLNENIRIIMNRKRLSLGKFWIREDLIRELENKKYISKLYHQEKIKSAFLTSFFIKENHIVLIGLPIPYIRESIVIVNKFLLLLMITALLLSVSIIFILINKIIKPLEAINNFGKDVAKLNFRQININTKDELEELSINMNFMSDKLKKSYEELDNKNLFLNELISNISHELKTPLSLIKAYLIGINDGLDDGTFFETLMKQVDNLNNLTNSLLENSKIEFQSLKFERVNLKNLFEDINKEFQVEYINKEIELEVEGLEDYYINFDKEKISIVFRNLISNSIKYTSNKKIKIAFQSNNEYIKFSITNGISKKVSSLEKLCEPFYVEEESRDKKLSGTGLGLYIVKNILKNHKYSFFIEENKMELSFCIEFFETC